MLFGPGKHGVSSDIVVGSLSPVVPSSKWPISTAKLTFGRKPQRMTFDVSAVLYSGRKSKGDSAQVWGLVFSKPLAVLATILPEVDAVTSLTSVSSATPLSLMVIVMLSPGFM